MSYRKRENPIAKVCQQCQADFTTWHAGQVYCGQACNMTAWRHRHKLPLQEVLSEPVSALDKFSLLIPGVATAAAGVLLADGAKAMFTNEPTIADLLKRIDGLENKLGYGMGKLVGYIKVLQDHNQAVQQENHGLALTVSSVRKRRLKNSA